MSGKKMVVMDGNQAAAHVAYAFSEVAAIYPITPSTPMGQYSDAWSAVGRKNVFGDTVEIMEMQSEAGAAGAVHGALSGGALTTTFTASQGLLLMIPNMYKIAGEMIPTVFHVSARSLASQSLSIFGDHADVMGARQTGFAITAASSIQETMDMALVAHLSTLESQVPFMSFFDGFRTSHEFQTVEEIAYDDMKSLIVPEYIERFKKRGMRPEHPTIKVAAQNPDVYFQGRETTNKYYDEVPSIVQKYMDQVGELTGRKYNLFDYVGAKDAEKIVIIMGSGSDTVEAAVNFLVARGEKVGAIKVRLFKPFSVKAFIDAIPSTVNKIAVLDRTKECGSLGEPLYQDVVTAYASLGKMMKIIGGRYGLSSKEFVPSHVKAVFDHLDGKCFHSFTVGINDDVTNLSIPVNEHFDVSPKNIKSCMFWGLGSDGTIGATKNSTKIIGNNAGLNAQSYFVYDSKKSGGVTCSHLRFGQDSCNMPWLINSADIVSCNQPSYIGKYDMLGPLKKGGTFVLNSDFGADKAFDHLTKEMQEYIIANEIKFYNIDALKIAKDAGLGNKINTVMQAIFFKLTGLIPEQEAIQLMKDAIKKTFIKKGQDIVDMNWACIDAASAGLEEVKIPTTITKSFIPPEFIPIKADTPDFIKDILKPVSLMKGDDIPVSAMSFDGVIPTGTAKYEKRGVAPVVPIWLEENCIQCNQCVMACPHAAIRAAQITPEDVAKAPVGFNTLKSTTKNDKDLQYRIQVYTEDCTGCGVCVDVCPGKKKVNALEMKPLPEVNATGEVARTTYFDTLPEVFDGLNMNTYKGTQFKKPLFEFSGACAGCGETPYVKLMSQLFGTRILAANATGCSSIYGGTFPSIPYTTDKNGRGPAWGNSLFEDNAEYGFGMRLAVDSNRSLLKIKTNAVLEAGTNPELTSAFKTALENWKSKEDAQYNNLKVIEKLLPAAISAAKDQVKEDLEKISELVDYYIDKSVWIIGGDGWAYDIGYSGVDHVVSNHKNVNILVLDTEVYSNTGGQASKATPVGAVAKFAEAGMRNDKKNMAMMCMSYGHVYVGSISMGANRAQTQKVFEEAEAWDGPSIIFAYSPCIAHGINMAKSSTEMKRAVDSGYWPLFRFNPALTKGERFSWDSKEPKESYQDFIRGERRYTALGKTAPDEMETLFAEAEENAKQRWDFYKQMGEVMS
ncbi:MAG: pyruvate:ferredoxin (flavodoxin) oxidoreductase [Spirochaetaceae bacterium 4572_7]|nr:MAG: pyruvate:ferredoxin (flavodoxin) oxidoreductase [Spirochaetaceae bacterium 4572_7]